SRLRDFVRADGPGAHTSAPGLIRQERTLTTFGRREWIAAGLALLVLATAPLWIFNSFYLNVGSQILFWAIFAQGLNVLVGYAGLTSLGHAALFAMSGYTSAIL